MLNIFTLLLLIASWCQPYSFPSIEESSIDELNRLVEASSHEGPQDHPKSNRGSSTRRSEDSAEDFDESHLDFLEKDEGEDANDFKSITVAIAPPTYRRYLFRKPQYEKVVHPWYNLGDKNHNKYYFYDLETDMLVWKDEAMHNLCRDYLYLARHKVAWALKRRTPIKDHNRYKMGYLFGRLRRIQTEMMKIVTYANERGNFIEHYPYPTDPPQTLPAGYKITDNTMWNNGTKFLYARYFNITTIMRLYERLSRLDRDHRDTTVLLKEIYVAEVKHQKAKHEAAENGFQ